VVLARVKQKGSNKANAADGLSTAGVGREPSRPAVVGLLVLALVAQQLRSAFTQIVMWLT